MTTIIPGCRVQSQGNVLRVQEKVTQEVCDEDKMKVTNRPTNEGLEDTEGQEAAK